MVPSTAKPGKLDVRAVAGAVIISLIQEDGTVSFNLGLSSDQAMKLGCTIAQAALLSERGNNGGIIIAEGDPNVIR